MIIDAYCHFAPNRFFREYVKSQLPKLIRFYDIQGGPESSHIWSEEERIKIMDRHHIDVEAVSIAYRPIWLTVPESDQFRLTRIANDSIAEVVKKYPERMVGVGMLPTLAGEAIDELDRMIKDLGMKGCLISSNIRGKPLDSPEFSQFYDRMARYDLPIWIHPTNWKFYEWINEYDLLRAFGWPFDSSLAMARIVFGGILQKHPNLKIITHHTGAMVPFFANRVKQFYDEATAGDGGLQNTMFPNAGRMKDLDILDYFRKFYADTILNGLDSALRCGYDFFGADHLLFATDFPNGPERGEPQIKETIRSVNALDVPAEAKEKIFYRNAARILKLAV